MLRIPLRHWGYTKKSNSLSYMIVLLWDFICSGETGRLGEAKAARQGVKRCSESTKTGNGRVHRSHR